MNPIKPLFTALSLAFAALLFSPGCSTVSPTTGATVSGSTVTLDVAAVLTPILNHNPAEKPVVLALGTALPGLLANGPITPDAYTKAVAGLPGVTPQIATDLSYAGGALDLALFSYQMYSGQTVVLYTDPNVKVIVDGFAAALVQAASP